MSLEKEIAEAMEQHAEWRGDSDALWQKVEARISLPEAQPKVRPWRIPAWGAAAAAVAIVVGIWATAPDGVPGSPSTPGTSLDATKGKGSPKREPQGANKVPNAGQNHSYLGFGIDAAQEVFQPGAPIQLHFRFQGGTDDPVTILEDPRLVIVPLSAPYDFDHPGTVLSSAVGEVTVPGLKGRTVAPGAEVTADVTWSSAQIPSGWYRVVLAPLKTQIKETVNQMAQGGDERFLIAYPAGALRLGTIEPGAQVVQHGVTLTVDRVDFTERSTKVSYHLSGVQAPNRLSLSLTRPEGPAALLTSGLKGFEGFTEFDPTPAGSSSLTITVPEVDGLQGPWTVTLPLH